MTIDYAAVLGRAEQYKPAISRFLRDLIALPSESCQEREVIRRIQQEMESVGFDRVEIDPMGNVLGYIGTGRHLIAMDAHIDNVGVGNPENWTFDPFTGCEDDEVIGGRGASDQTGGMASLVYAGRIIKDLALGGDYTLLVTGTVQEEDCDGLCWQYIVEKSGIRPEFVVSTEPTSCRIHRGQRGRMEIKVAVRGVSAHGSAPERGDNAIFKMGPILAELQELHTRLPGQGVAHRVRDLLHLAQPVRRGGRLHHLDRPPADGGRVLGGGAGGDPAPACRAEGRGPGVPL
jgi:putative selenium metabolism hydrolase